MKKIILLSTVFFCCLQLSRFAIQAQTNKINHSNPSNVRHGRDSEKLRFAELNSVFYFSAEDGIHGDELWRSDGTEAGTKLVKDINPGTTSSDPHEIIASGNKIFFVASDNEHGPEVWVSDGTDAGTKLLLDIIPGTVGSGPVNLTDVNGTLFFLYNNAYPNGAQLWKTDGTEAGTVLVVNFNPFIHSGVDGQAINVYGRLFFILYAQGAATRTALYTSDGTAGGTTLVAYLNEYGPFPFNANPSLTALNGLLYFSADDGTGYRLFVSDGTAAGTHAVKNKNNIYLPGNQTGPFAVKNNTLFFQGNTINSTTLTATGQELYEYNSSGTDNNITLVKDIVPGENSSYPGFITNVNGTLFFTISPDGADAELWKSDGTEAGTVLVKDINPGGKNLYESFINFNGTLVFAYGNDSLGTELWKSDGTSDGTVLVKDILPGDSSSFPQFLTYKSGIFLFSANGPAGTELWRTDGTEAGTIMVKNINPENIAPTISLAIPFNIVKYSAPARIKLTATATDEDGTITKVRFYNGTTRIHTETIFPYGFLWDNVPVGNYTLTAKAIDDDGNVTTSKAINILVVDENVPPVVTIVSPADDTTYTGPATIHLIAKAKDPNDRISKVEWYNGTTLIRTENIYPYTITWDNVQPGTYTITAKATDDKGLSATSEPVTVTVTAPPELYASRSSSAKINFSDNVSLRVSPNPVHNTLQIYTKGLQQDKRPIITVLSASGVIMKTIYANATNKIVQLDVSSFASGVYTAKVVNGDKVMYKQFVKL